MTQVLFILLNDIEHRIHYPSHRFPSSVSPFVIFSSVQNLMEPAAKSEIRRHKYLIAIHYFCKQPVMYENHKIGDISIFLF